MNASIRLLHVEDNPADAELVARALRHAGYQLACKVVETEADFIAELDRAPDIVVSDYTLPRFSALRALELLKARYPDVPFLVVSGTIGEEKAVEAIQLGADDYVWKDRLARLPTAVGNAVRAARERAARREAQDELDAFMKRIRSLVTALPDAVWSVELPTLQVLYMSPAATQVFGRKPSEFYEARSTWLSIIHPEDRERVMAGWREPPVGEYRSEYRIVNPAGEVRWIQTHGRLFAGADGNAMRLDAISRDVTDRVRLTEALHEREAGLRHAQEMAKIAHVVTGPDGSIEHWSETLPQLAGVAAAELPRSTRAWLALVHPDDRARFRAESIEAARTSRRNELEYRLQRPDASVIHVRQTTEPLEFAPDGRPRRWFNTLQDITEAKLADARIQRLNRVYAVLSRINAAIVRIDDQQELLDEACRIAVEAGHFAMAWIGLVDEPTGLVRPVAEGGERVREFLERAPLALLETHADGRGLAGRAIRLRAPMLSNDVKNDPQHLMREELAERGIHSLAILPLMRNEEAVGALALYARDTGFFDEEEMRLLAELAGDVSFALGHIDKTRQLAHLMHYDSLTGLANRTLFQERLAQHLAAAGREGRRAGLVLLDLQRFKSVNDSLGRHTGDALLQQVAQRVREVARDASWVARTGGDEFAIAVPDATSAEELARRNQARLDAAFDAPFQVGTHTLRLSAQVGIAFFPDDAADAEELFNKAEAALKRAKAAGERMLFYKEEMTARVAEKLALENKLRTALANGEFVLHYQPKYAARSGAMSGLEALLRWQSPELGLVPPLDFVPLLEETALILPVGAWVLERAARDHRDLAAAGLAPPNVAVNVSAIQLRQSDFVATVQRAIAGGLSPSYIELEITESLVMEDIRANMEKLTALRRMGVGVSIDDFGTGYSSLFYLARLPAQALKIDLSFTTTMMKDRSTMTMVQTMISLAHSLGLRVIAEGVETQEQAKILRALRCDELQGYLFSRPLPLDQLTELLRRGRKG